MLEGSKTIGLKLLCAAVIAVGAGAAHAQEDEPGLPSTFELSMGLGYGQGIGPVGHVVPRLQDLGGPGGQFFVSGGWRFDPRWLVGVYAELGVYDSGNLSGTDQALSLAAGVEGQYHFRPYRQRDPWIGLGFGWRGYWSDRGMGFYKLQGLDLARVRVGLDYRVTSTFAAGPVLGCTLTDMLWSSPPQSGGYTDVTGNKINTFVFAGFAGRFGF
jgi:hypothetical protein